MQNVTKSKIDLYKERIFILIMVRFYKDTKRKSSNINSISMHTMVIMPINLIISIYISNYRYDFKNIARLEHHNLQLQTNKITMY